MLVNKYYFYTKCPQCGDEDVYTGCMLADKSGTMSVVCKKCYNTLLKIKTEPFKDNPILTEGNKKEE